MNYWHFVHTLTISNSVPIKDTRPQPGPSFWPSLIKSYVTPSFIFSSAAYPFLVKSINLSVLYYKTFYRMETSMIVRESKLEAIFTLGLGDGSLVWPPWMELSSLSLSSLSELLGVSSSSELELSPDPSSFTMADAVTLKNEMRTKMDLVRYDKSSF